MTKAEKAEREKKRVYTLARIAIWAVNGCGFGVTVLTGDAGRVVLPAVVPWVEDPEDEIWK